MTTTIRNGKISREIHEYLKLLADWNGLDSEFRTEIQAKWNDIFTNRKEPEMKLDRDAIKRRFEEAVVYSDGVCVAILLPNHNNTFTNIDGGFAWAQKDISTAVWTISKGDKCEVSSNEFGCFKVGCRFEGFTGDINYPFRVVFRDGVKGNFASIRPIPQLTERQKRIQNIKNELAELEKLEGGE